MRAPGSDDEGSGIWFRRDSRAETEPKLPAGRTTLMRARGFEHAMEVTPADLSSVIARTPGPGRGPTPRGKLAALVAMTVALCAGTSSALAQYYVGGPANNG